MGVTIPGMVLGFAYSTCKASITRSMFSSVSHIIGLFSGFIEGCHLPWVIELWKAAERPANKTQHGLSCDEA